MGNECKGFWLVKITNRKKVKKIILASNSPRRKELLSKLDVDFEVKVLPDISETYPNSIPSHKVPEFIAQEKAKAYDKIIDHTNILLTADTIVLVDNKILGKPKSFSEAYEMLRILSGRTHKVITGVCLRTDSNIKTFSVETEVTFKNLQDKEISYYIAKYSPLDKAGAYGIQEWIGYIGVTCLRGSYFNVMGLPVQRVWEELKSLEV